jgi:hypothetical protein
LHRAHDLAAISAANHFAHQHRARRPFAAEAEPLETAHHKQLFEILGEAGKKGEEREPRDHDLEQTRPADTIGEYARDPASEGGNHQCAGREQFRGHGYDQLFRTSGRVYFAGCNCADGDDGWAFLEAAGAIFLRSGGGQAFGWTSLGFAVPSFFRPSGGHAVHLWGDVRSANFDFHGNLVGRFENGVKQ